MSWLSFKSLSTIGCPMGYSDMVSNSDYCYQFSGDLIHTISNARQQCQEQGAELMDINNKEENDIFAKFYEDLIYKSDKYGFTFIVGFKKECKAFIYR